ncbi:MAG: MBL fold metallo-hydrolase [Bacteroidia bacterium]|jgi:pyrroloquinoline quinone biosynthesis protein B
MKRLVCLALVSLSFFVKAQAPYVLILGITQDGGLPHTGCEKPCCKVAWKDPNLKVPVSCLAIIDPVSKQSWMIDATPDYGMQLQMLRKHMQDSTHLPSAIFLTHAHIGHYAGLMQLGKEVMSARQMPVYALPRMLKFLTTNGPWSQLVSLGNIKLQSMNPGEQVICNARIRISPFLVPHRDEFSETAGFSISTDAKKYIFIPDIDKWEKWYPEQTAGKLDSLFAAHDYVLIDGTFYNSRELGGRDLREIPHPTVTESMQLFASFKNTNPKNVYFIHLNHSNPLLRSGPERDNVLKKGFRLAETEMRLD